LRDFWRKQRRKILVTTTCLGSGLLIYKLYNAHTRNLADLERELANERHNDELIKAQMKAHFETIQMIADTTTLPHALHHLSSRIVEEINVSSVMEKLSRGKGTLVPSEKLHLWSELKILSFTRMVVTLWSVTMLSLYIRVQVNILGRHLYIDTARGLASSHLLEELDLIDREDEQKFLTSADYLATNSMPSLISHVKSAVKEVLKGKQLKDVLTTRTLEETVIRILGLFMSTGSPHHWIDYLMMPQDTTTDVSSSDATVTKFHLLVTETREVLTSNEFTDVVEIALKSCTVALVEEMETQPGLATGIQLAKLLPQIEKTVPEISAVPDKNRFLQLIRDLPQAVMATNNGDVLMLEAAPEASKPWASAANAEVIDALPYIDDDYGNPLIKAEVDRLVEEEMRRSSRKPADFLKELPPLPKFDFENCPVLAKEYERVRAGKPPVRIDFESRYKLELPPASKKNDDAAWKQYLQKNQRSLQQKMIELENLEMMSKQGPELWRQNNHRLEVFLTRMQKLAQEQNEEIEKVNRERKYHQQTTAYELNALSQEWRQLCLKNMEIQSACVVLETKIDAFKKEAAERGWNLEEKLESAKPLQPQ
ncbi:unnamed protein product, partial [Brassica oleracea]